MRASVRVLGLSLALIGAPLFATALLAQDAGSFAVIVHPSNPTRSLDRATVSRLMLRKQAAWGHGGAVYPVEQASGSPVKRAFASSVHKKSESALKAYWQQQIFSGRGVPPTEFDSDAHVVAYVRKHPGAIGYVSAGAPRQGVERVEIR